MLRALYEVISKSGSNMSETSRTAVLGLIDSDGAGIEGTTSLRIGIHAHTDSLQSLWLSRMPALLERSSKAFQPMPTLQVSSGTFDRHLYQANLTTGIRQRVLTQQLSTASILNLNSVLLESPATLTQSYAQETSTLISQGIRSKNVCDNSMAEITLLKRK